MNQIINITNDAHQTQTLLTDDGNITLTLRFYPMEEAWIMDVTYGNKSVFGVKLSLSVLHLEKFNLPFDFKVTGTAGIDPYHINDFLDGRCTLWFVNKKNMEEYRGIAV